MAKQKVQLEAADLAAFCAYFLNKQPIPVRREDGRIVFEFSDDIGEALDAFYSNTPVPIGDYIQRLKHVRSMIFTMNQRGSKR